MAGPEFMKRNSRFSGCMTQNCVESFASSQDAYHTVCCGTPDPGPVVEEKRVVTFPEESSSGRYIVVRHTRTKYRPENDSKRPVSARSRLVSCTAFRWTSERFTFLADKAESPKFCGGK